MRFRLLSLLLAVIGGAVPLAAATAQQKAIGQISCILELYTSQGCSSCPPADALLKTFADLDGVLALSFNVDIWDNLGWKDTLATPGYTQRQRAYARTRGDGQVYTPQTVINGMSHAVGSDRAGIEQEIKTTAAHSTKMRVSLGVAADGKDIQVEMPQWAIASAAAVDATLWLVKFTPRIEVAIKRGENAGRTIAYHNVVRELTAVGSWMGEAKTAKLSHQILSGCTPGTCAVLLQQGGTGSILGAAWVPGLSGT